MSDNKEPGWFDGLVEGFTKGRKKPEDSPRLADAKAKILECDLTLEEMGDLGGWLLGEVVKGSFTKAINDLDMS